MSNSNTFHQLKREFLHRQLDEVIAIWARGTGQGKFKLKVAEGVPYFQFRFQLNFQNVHKSHHNPHQHPHHTKQRLGPARQSRDRLRLRAAEHQAKSAVAASVTAENPL